MQFIDNCAGESANKYAPADFEMFIPYSQLPVRSAKGVSDKRQYFAATSKYHVAEGKRKASLFAGLVVEDL